MTDQVREKIIYDGVERNMRTTPNLPDDDSLVKFCDDGVISSACWRGYVGTWEVKDSRLYLIELDGKYSLTGEGPLFASWFTGDLFITLSDGYFSLFERYCDDFFKEVVISIVFGHVVSKRFISDELPKLFMPMVPRLNRLLGRLLMDSVGSWWCPDPFDKEMMIIAFKIDGFIPFEMNAGRIAANLNNLPEGVSFCFKEPSRGNHYDSSYLIAVSLGAAWGKAICDFFDISETEELASNLFKEREGWVSTFHRSRLLSSKGASDSSSGAFGAVASEYVDDFDDDIPF